MIQQPTITEALPKPAAQLRACLQSRAHPDSHLCVASPITTLVCTQTRPYWVWEKHPSGLVTQAGVHTDPGSILELLRVAASDPHPTLSLQVPDINAHTNFVVEMVM